MLLARVSNSVVQVEHQPIQKKHTQLTSEKEEGTKTEREESCGKEKINIQLIKLYVYPV